MTEKVPMPCIPDTDGSIWKSKGNEASTATETYKPYLSMISGQNGIMVKAPDTDCLILCTGNDPLPVR